MAKVKRKEYGKKKSKELLIAKAKKVASQGNKRLYSDLRLKAKAANERMRQLEKAGVKSPAYQAVQAELEILGKRNVKSGGRRFSETGRATYNEYELINKILNDFLYNDKTSTIKGAREYNDKIWNTANKNAKLDQLGITKDEWLEFWEAMGDKKDRLYDSSQNVAILRAYSMQGGKLRSDDRLTPKEIAELIQKQKKDRTLKDVYKDLGLKLTDVTKASINYDSIRKSK